MTTLDRAPSPTAAVSLDTMLATGATYRQLDYWRTHGYLSLDGRPPAAEGPGVPRLWTRRERDLADVLVRLRALGLHMPLATNIARTVVVGGTNSVRVGDGITVTVERPVTP